MARVGVNRCGCVSRLSWQRFCELRGWLQSLVGASVEHQANAVLLSRRTRTHVHTLIPGGEAEIVRALARKVEVLQAGQTFMVRLQTVLNQFKILILKLSKCRIFQKHLIAGGQ